MSLGWVKYGHIDEGVLNAMCFDFLESGKFIVTKHCDTKMSMVCIVARA